MKKLKIMILNFSKHHHIVRVILRKIKFLKKRLLYFFFYVVNNVEDDIILFEVFMGRNYSDSEKAVYQYLLSKNANYKYIWAFKNPENYSYLQSNSTIVVKYGSKEHYKYYSKAKYWISNSRINEAIIKKKKQVYIQTWHGTPLKKLGYDIKIVGGNAMNTIHDIRKKYSSDSKRYDYMISPSSFCTEKFMSAFNLKNKKIIEEIGYPRNDFLINYKKRDINIIKKKLNINIKKKVILYAPTWRDNQHMSGIGYTYTPPLSFDKLREKFGKDYIILFRAHYFVANEFDFKKYKNFVYDVSKYDDVNELYIISDVLITDYSSVFFDYSILKKPIIFYMYDLENYQNKLRDFYIKLDELPGKIVEKEESLITEIENIQNFQYDDRYKQFNSKYSYLEDGKSSERLCKVCKIIK